MADDIVKLEDILLNIYKKHRHSVIQYILSEDADAVLANFDDFIEDAKETVSLMFSCLL